MFEFNLDKQIILNSLIQLLFDADNGNDQPCLNILDGWLDDKELYSKFTNKTSNWTTSPDLDSLNIEVVGNKVLLSFEVGVEVDGDINADQAEFYININKSNIYKYVFFGDTLDDEI